MLVVTVGLAGPIAAEDGWVVEMTGGFGSSSRTRVESFATFGGYLWVGLLDPVDGCDVWVRGIDVPMMAWFPAVQDGFGNPTLHHAASMDGFQYDLGGLQTRLLVGTYNFAVSGAEVWSSDGSAPFVQAGAGGLGNAHNYGISALERFNGSLYAGTANITDGAEIHHFTGLTWVPDMAGGFGSTSTYIINDLEVHDGKLWAATTFGPAGEIWWSSNGSSWYSAHAPGFFGGPVNSLLSIGGVLYAGTASTGTSLQEAQVWRIDPGPVAQVNSDGFGVPSNDYVSVLVAYRGEMYAGTRNDILGAEVWRYRGGSWTPVVRGGFGDSGNIEVDAMAVAGEDLVVGTWNGGGGQIWRYPLVFADGLETGHAGAWSAVAP